MKLLLAVALLLVVLYHVNAQVGAPSKDQTNRVNNMNYLRELMMARMRAQQQQKQTPQWPQRRPFVPRPRFMPMNNLLAGAYLANNDAFDDMFDSF